VWLRQVRFEVLLLSCLAVPYGSGSDRFQGKTPLLVGDLIRAHEQRPVCQLVDPGRQVDAADYQKSTR
jgi:hypothetical protein